MTGARPPMPTTTAHAIRLLLFQPTRRPEPVKGQTIETPWGKIRLWGRLGQAHADVLEAICFCREKRKDLEDGAIKLLVDPAEVRRRSRQDGTTLKRILLDLQQAVIEIIEPKHLACQGQLIGHIDFALRGDGSYITRQNPFGGERHLWSVTLGPVLTRLVQADVWVGYDPAPIARMRHGISQAIARHVLSHKTAPRGGWNLDGLIRAASGELNDQQLRDRRREIRADAEALAAIGVQIEGGRVSRRVEQNRDGVEQNRDGVEQNRDGVEQNRGAWSKTAALAGTRSDALQVHLQEHLPVARDGACQVLSAFASLRRGG